MRKTDRLIAVSFLFGLLLAAQTTPALSYFHHTSKGATVAVFIEGNFSAETLVVLMKNTGADGDANYDIQAKPALPARQNSPVAQFDSVPFGSYIVDIDDISNSRCASKQLPSFSFEKNVRRVEVRYDAQSCNFSFSFSR